MLSDLLRTLYVEVASQEIVEERARTDSRVSLMTGIHRKELRRQRSESRAAAEPALVTLNSRLIGRWLGDAAFLDSDGATRTIPRSGPAPSFEALVTSVTKDVHPRSILDDWVSQGIAGVDAAGLVSLQAHAFLPPGASEAKAVLLRPEPA